MKNLLLFLFLCFSANALIYAEQNAVLKLNSDSVKVGENFTVTLQFSHLPEKEIFFPDSSFQYENLHYVHHTPHPTHTDSLSIDSATYTFKHFSIDDSIKIELPIFILSKKDSIRILSNPLWLYTKRTLSYLPEKLELKEQTTFLSIKKPFHTALVAIIGGTSGLLIIVLLFLFRKNIRRSISHFILKKKVNKLLVQMRELSKKEQFTHTTLNAFSGLTKKCLSHLSGQAVSAYTTKEIQEIFPKELFNTQLFYLLDQHIYRKTDSQNVKKTLLELIAETEKMLQDKLNTK